MTAVAASFSTSNISTFNKLDHDISIINESYEQLQPEFENSTQREVVAAIGTTASLHCRVRNLGDRAVSWIRKRDLHILTIAVMTYTNDQRFLARHTDNSDEWVLKIVSVQSRDAGIYECQVSTEPKISQAYQLTIVSKYTLCWNVRFVLLFLQCWNIAVFCVNCTKCLLWFALGSKAQILANRELFIQSGSDINLTCIAPQAPGPYTQILWFKDNELINDSTRGGIRVVSEQQIKTSNLIISKVLHADSGNYTCAADNSSKLMTIAKIDSKFVIIYKFFSLFRNIYII